MLVAPACDDVLGIQEFPSLNVPAADATDDGVRPPDVGSPDAADGGAGADVADASTPVGTALVLGPNITLIGVTSEGMAIYSDGTDYSGVSLVGGPPILLAPVTAAGVDRIVVVGSSVFYWGSSTAMVAASGCPSCATPFPTLRYTGAIPNAPPIASPDGVYYAFLSGNVDANGFYDASAPTSLWLMSGGDTQLGVPLPVLQSLVQYPSFQFTSSDELVSVYSDDDGGDAGTVVRASVFQGNGNAIASHVVAPAVATRPCFDHEGKFLYYSAQSGGLERLSLSDFSTTLLMPPPAGCSSISPDDTVVWSGADLISTQTGAVAATLPPYDLIGFTDDWSFVVFANPPSLGSATSPVPCWVAPVGGQGQVALGTPPYSSYDDGLFHVTSLSNSTLLVRDGSIIRVFDATGKAQPIVVTDSVVFHASAWALSSDRRRVVYVSQAAPAGLYAVALP
jgi:hypothetical protein